MSKRRPRYYGATVSLRGLHEYIDKPYATERGALQAINRRRTWLSQGADAVVLTRAQLNQALAEPLTILVDTGET